MVVNNVLARVKIESETFNALKTKATIFSTITAMVIITGKPIRYNVQAEHDENVRVFIRTEHTLIFGLYSNWFFNYFKDKK